MHNNKKTRVLVVGSHSHPLATNTISWGERFYIGDYDAVIFSLPWLDSKKISEILTRDPDYFQAIKKHIIDLQTQDDRGGFPIYCIMDNIVYKNSYEEKIELSNYAWSPIVPILEEVPGKEIQKNDSKLSTKYLKLIEGWVGFLDSFENNTGIAERDLDSYGYTKLRFRYYLNSLLKNAAGKDIAFEVSWLFKKEGSNGYSTPTVAAESPITFLPKTKKPEEGINVLLELLTCVTENEIPPPWVSKSTMHGEDAILQEIGEIAVALENAQKNINGKTNELDELREYKKLLYAQGDELHEVVERSLKLLGVNVKRSAIANKEDLIFDENGQYIPMEIRGKDTSGLNEGDVRQVLGRFQDKTGSELYKTRGVFILNGHRLKPPEERPESFHPNIIKDNVKPWSICLITTNTLYELVNLKLSGESMEFFKEEFLNTIGVYTYLKKSKTSEKKAE